MCECTAFFFSVTSVLLLWKRFNSLLLLLLHKTIWSIFLEKHIAGVSRICELYWRQYEQPVGKSINAQVIYSTAKHRAIYKDEWILCRALILVVRFHTFKSDPICICLHQKDGFGQMNWIQNYCLGCVTTGYTMTTLNFIHSLLQKHWFHSEKCSALCIHLWMLDPIRILRHILYSFFNGAAE